MTGTLVVEGEPGIGKSTLLEAAQQLATGLPMPVGAGNRVRDGAQPRGAAAGSLSPLRDRVAELPGRAGLRAVRRLGWGPAAGPADRFLVCRGDAVRCWPPSPSRHRCWCWSTICNGSTGSQRAAVAFAARRLHDDPVCFLVARRTGSITARSSCRVFPPSPCGACPGTDARLLVRDRLAEGVVDRLVDDTGGNPLAIAGGCCSPHRRPAGRRRRHCPTRCPSATASVRCTTQLLDGLSTPAQQAVLLCAVNLSGSSSTVTAALARDGAADDPTAALDEAHATAACSCAMAAG